MKRTILSKRTILWSVSKRNFFYNKPHLHSEIHVIPHLDIYEYM